MINESTEIEATISQLDFILCSVQQEFTKDPNGFFAKDHISSLGKYIQIVANLCTSLNLSDYNELQQHLKNSTFFDLQNRWNNFLSELDHQSIISSSYPSELLPGIQLLNVNNNKWIDLKDIYTNHDRNLFVFLRHLA